MVSRRGPRWMLWPAKLLWVPLLLAGATMAFVTGAEGDQIGDGQFRVGLRLFEPSGWTEAPVLHGAGVVLLLAGFALLRLYLWLPEPDRRGVVEEFPLWTLAAWSFLFVGLGATWRLTGHVWDVGPDGVEWRFLAQLRTHAVDRSVAVAGLVAALGCSIMSYGRSAFNRYWAPEAHAQRRRQDPEGQ